MNLSLAYMGALKYPGTRVGMELPISISELVKEQSNRKKTIIKERFFTANIGWYHHPSFHDNVFVTAGSTLRRIQHKGFFTQLSPEMGYSRTFLGATSYSVDENGQVRINKLAGYHHLLLSTGLGMGYDLEKIRDIPFSIYAKFNVLFMYPYNSTFYVRPAAEVGFIYKTKSLIGHNVKSKIKAK